MALLHTVSSVVRLPLRAATKAVATITSLLPGHGHPSTPAPAPTDVKPAAPAAPTPPKAAKAPVAKPAAKGPVTPASTGPTPDPAAPAPAAKTAAKKAPAKKAPAKKAPAAKAAPAATLPAPVVEPEPAPVTEIDAHATDEPVEVTPADVAAAMGSQLSDEQPPTS